MCAFNDGYQSWWSSCGRAGTSKTENARTPCSRASSLDSVFLPFWLPCERTKGLPWIHIINTASKINDAFGSTCTTYNLSTASKRNACCIHNDCVCNRFVLWGRYLPKLRVEILGHLGPPLFYQYRTFCPLVHPLGNKHPLSTSGKWSNLKRWH